jgi:multiple sugar transport system substrate-binding protein
MALAADVSDIAEEISSSEGGLYPYSRAVTSDGKKFNSMPWTIVGAMNAYRKSWFDEVGLTKFPETWEAYHEAGKQRAN